MAAHQPSGGPGSPVDLSAIIARAPKRSRLTDRRKEALFALLFVSPWLIGFLVFSLGAMIYSLRLSFFDTNLLNRDDWVGMKNCKELWDDRRFWIAVRITAAYTLIVVPLQTVLGVVIAVLLNQKLRFSSLWRALFYVPSVVSGVAVAVIWNWILNPSSDGLMNQFLGVSGIPSLRWFASSQWALTGLILVALWGTGSSMLLYLAGLQGIPTEIKEACRVDGAGTIRGFFSVTLPMLTPTIFFNLIVNVIASFQIFTMVAVITQGGPNNATLTMVYLQHAGTADAAVILRCQLRRCIRDFLDPPVHDDDPDRL